MRGGPRPGGGRPKGSLNKRTLALKAGQPVAGVHTPLSYMLAIMNDPNAETERRDRMAIACAPYVHGKPLPVGKKAASQEAAAEAAARYQPSRPPPKLLVFPGHEPPAA